MMELQVLETLVLVVHVLAALAIIGLVLIQQGKGADMGSGFGSGASATVFGSVGAGNFLTRATTGLAILFFITSFGLAFFAKTKSESTNVVGMPVVERQVEGEIPELPGLPSTQDQEVEIPSFETPGSDTESNE